MPFSWSLARSPALKRQDDKCHSSCGNGLGADAARLLGIFIVLGSAFLIKQSMSFAVPKP